MATIGRELQKEKGILSLPSPKIGRGLLDNTIHLITEYYRSDENSRPLPGMKDYVTVRNDDGTKVKLQKRLVYCDLKELYRNFKLEYPNCGIGFSKFAELRPQECVLAGACGTHTVCVCIIHQNMKLMIEGNKTRCIHGISDYEKFMCTNLKYR